jgi:hypothetical protein
MTRQELINLAGSEEKAERAIDAILAGIKPQFALMAIKAADINVKHETQHRYYIGFLRDNLTVGHVTFDAWSESEARHDFCECYRHNVRTILCTVDLGETEAIIAEKRQREELGLQ